MDVRTIPQPYIPEDEEPENSPRGNYKGKKRKIKKGNNPVEDVVISGVPPLKWVQYARKILSEGVNGLEKACVLNERFNKILTVDRYFYDLELKAKRH